MNRYIIDSFSTNKGIGTDGGSEFALRLVDFCKVSGIDFLCIDSTKSEDRNILQDLDLGKCIYVDPLFVRASPFVNFERFKKVVFVVHGARIFEKPYSEDAYLYFTGISKIKVFILSKIFNNILKNRTAKYIQAIDEISNAEILSPSVHTKYVLRQLVNTQVKVFPPFWKKYDGELINIKNLPSNYILVLGGDRWVKNTRRLIEIFIKLKNQGFLINMSLVVVGLEKQEMREDIVYFGYLNSGELHFLYKHCSASAFLSYNEGFGYPPMDALSWGKPVLCTSVSAPNLIYHTGIIFCDPNNNIEIGSRLLYLYDLLVDDHSFNDLEMIRFSSNFSHELELQWLRYLQG